MEARFLATWAVIIVTTIICVVFCIIQLDDCLQATFRNRACRRAWILAMVLTGPVGALLYHLIGRKQKNPKDTMR